MKRAGTGAAARLAISGLAAAILFSVIFLAPAVVGADLKFSALLPIAFFQAMWCFAEGWVVQKFRPLSGQRDSQDRPGILPLASGMVATVIAVLAVRETILSGSAAPGFIAAGYLVGSAGILLRQLSIIELGPFFRDAIDLLEDHDHVSTGIFAYCRHPAEFGFALAMGALLLISGSGIATIVFGLLLVPLMLARVLLENRLMRERFVPETERDCAIPA